MKDQTRGLAPLTSSPTENITALFGALVRGYALSETLPTGDVEDLTKVEPREGGC